MPTPTFSRSGPAVLLRRVARASVVVVAAAVSTAGVAAGQGVPDPSSRCPEGLEILVPRATGEALSLAPGDEIRVRSRRDGPSCAARVAGLYRPADDPARLAVDRPRLLFHLPQLARLVGRESSVDRFSVALRPGVDTAVVAAELEALMPATRVLATASVARESSTAFEVVRRFHRAIGVITLAAGSVFLACIMTLRVEQRRSEVAALRLIGISRSTLLGWVTAESAVVAALGGVLGLGIGRLAAGVINAYYRQVYDTRLVFASVTPEILGGVLVLSVVLGVGAGMAAGRRLLSLDALTEAGR